MFISETAIRRPVATVMFFLGVLILGAISATRLSVDLLPNLSYPKLTIWTSYSEVPPTEVEDLVTVRVEEALGTVPRVRRLNSVSKEGASMVVMEFLWGTDMDIAALNVREKLDNLRWNLPRAAGRPTILRLDPRSQPVMSLSVTGGSLVELKELSRNVFKRRLEQIDGVALAAVTGGFEREIQVEVDKRKLTALGITIDQVAAALFSANQNLSGGTIKKGRYRYALRTLGEFEQVGELEDVVISQSKTGMVVSIKDVAVVIDGFKERDAITRYNGKEAIGIIITKEAGSNTVEVSRKVQEVLGQLRTEYEGVQIAIASDQAKFISEAISNVLQAVLFGGILAFLVLFLFLHDLRNPVNIATAIPIAILATFALMYFFDVSLNMISLGGLALGVGMLVDNSIVVLENIFRHRQEGKNRIEAGFLGAKEVAMPVTASTLTTIAVFFPIVYVQGVAGQLFRDQSLTVTFSLIASLIVSLTLLPMLASRFFHRNNAESKSAKSKPEKTTIYSSLFEKRKIRFFTKLQKIGRKISKPFRWLGNKILLFLSWLLKWSKALFRFWFGGISNLFARITRPLFKSFDRGFDRFSQKYETVLKWSLENRSVVVSLTGVALVIALFLGFTLDRRLMPKIDQRLFSLNVITPPGTSLERMGQVTGEIEHILIKQPEILSIFSQIGLAENQTTTLISESALNRAQIQIQMTESGGSSEELIIALRKSLSMLEEVELSFESGNNLLSQFLGTSEADIAIKISGNDPVYSKSLAQQIKEKIEIIPGLTDIHGNYEEGRPEIRIKINREAAGRLGLSVRAITEFVNNQMFGSMSTQFKDFDRKIDILVRPVTEQRDELEDLLQAEIIIGKISIPARQVISAELTQGPVEIHRENQVQQLVLYGNVTGRGFSEVVENIEKAIAEVDYRFDYQVTVGGQREEMQNSFRSLILVFVLALLLVYMILAAQFESLKHPFVILFAVPLALIGVVFTIFVTGGSFNVMSLIGIVVLVGIVVNDAIIKIDFINQGRKAGLSIKKAIEEAGKKRLRPIIMTTMTTVLGLSPMAFGLGEGAELRSPLAIAVIGGLISATFLTLIVVPVLYSLITKEKNGTRI